MKPQFSAVSVLYLQKVYAQMESSVAPETKVLHVILIPGNANKLITGVESRTTLVFNAIEITSSRNRIPVAFLTLHSSHVSINAM